MKILIETSPLSSGHAIRGIGIYTRLLTQTLEAELGIEVVRSETPAAKDFVPDLIHYPYFDFFFETLPLIKKAPTLVTIHDVIPLIFPKHYQSGVKGKLRFLKQKAALKNVKGVITDSVASKNDIQEHLGFPSEKITVVSLAANPELKAASAKEIRSVKRRYKLPKNYVLYVGDINYNKNIPQLIKAVRYLPRHTKLVCVGRSFTPQDIPEWQWIQTQLALSDVEQRVKFISNLSGTDNQDLAAIYSGAQVYVQPSLYEGFGLPVLEAMQCKTPVVATKTSSLPEVGGKNAVYTQPTAEELAQGINQVLSLSKTKRQKMVNAAYKWSQNFSWKKTAKETAAVYQRVLKGESS